jgi:hypothetical protein
MKGREAAMYRCLICRFDVELDDAIAPTRRGTCICVRCYARETQNERQVPVSLRRELEEALAV